MYILLLQKKDEEILLEKIVDIIESMAHEKGLKTHEAKEAVSAALIKTAKRVFGEEYEYIANLDEDTKQLSLFQKVQVVGDDDERLEENVEGGEKYIALSEAKEIDPNVDIDDDLTYELSLDNLGRTAAAILYRELEFHINRVLENNIFERYKNKIGQIVNGTVTSIDGDENTYIEINEVRAILPRKSRIKGEKFKVGDVVKSVVRKTFIDKRMGLQIELSRTSPKFLEEMLRLQVPEINDEVVLIHNSARIPGERAKVALYTINPSVDPVGATVGTRGVRINAVSAELNGENIDCIEYSPTPEKFLSRALSPAIITGVRIEGEKAIITLPGDQKSKAIGKSGINIRLASMLTGYEIELNESTSGAGENISSEGSDDAMKALFGD